MSIWINQSSNIPSGTYYQVVCSSSSTVVAVSFSGNSIYINTNFGFSGFLTETPTDGITHEFTGLTISSDGSTIVTVSKNDNSTGEGSIYQLINTGSSWSFTPFTLSPSGNFTLVSMSNNGTKIVAISNATLPSDSKIWYSTDSGSTWSPSTYTITSGITALSCSPSGNIFIAADGEFLISSTDFGATWLRSIDVTSAIWTGITISDSTNFYACENASNGDGTGFLFKGIITSFSFENIPSAGNRNWSSISSTTGDSVNITNIIASAIRIITSDPPIAGGIYVSSDSGTTFNLQDVGTISTQWNSVVSATNTPNFVTVAPNTLYTFNAMCFLKGTLIKVLDTRYLYKNDIETYISDVKNLTEIELHCLKQIEMPIEDLKRGDLVCSVSSNSLSKIHTETPNDSTGLISFLSYKKPLTRPSGNKYFFNQIEKVGHNTMKSDNYSIVRVLRKDKISEGVPSKDLYLLFLHSLLFEELDHHHYNEHGLDLTKYSTEEFRKAVDCKKNNDSSTGVVFQYKDAQRWGNSKFVKISAFKSKHCEKITREEFERVFDFETEFYNIVLSHQKRDDFQAVIANNQMAESCDPYFYTGKFIEN